MEANAKKHLKIVIASSVAALIVIGGVWSHQNSVVSSNEEKAHSERVQGAHYLKDSRHFTESRLKKNYDKSEPNLGTLLRSAHNNITKGISLAFNNCKNKSSFNHNAPTVQKYLGSDISSQILKIVNPSAQNEDPTQPQSLNTCQVSFGAFDDYEDVVPVEIYIQYTTVPFAAGSGGVVLNPKKQHKTPHKGYMVINADLFTKTQKLEVNHKYINIQGINNND